MNTEATTEYIQSTNPCTISKDLIIHYLNKLHDENDLIMKRVYLNTLLRLIDGKLEDAQILPRGSDTTD